MAEARGVKLSAVQLDQMTHDRQAQPEPAVLARARAVGLAKALEDEGQKLRLDSRAGIADGDLDVRANAFESHLHAPVSGSKLDGVREQVPDDLLQAIRVAGDGPSHRIEHDL